MDSQTFILGPWDIEELPGGHNFSIFEKETGIHLANVGDANIGRSTFGVLSGNTILANAHLIACAPELLEAISDLVERANRCRKILQESTINSGNWGMLDTEKATLAINKSLNK